ncbi:MAG: TraB family protein [Candidatus Diapherotrites archaeon]
MPIEKIKFEEKEIILVGTAHISKKSVEEVRETIEKENPDAIGVELDEMRLRQLLEGKKWENTNIGEIINKGQSGILLLTILLSNMQKRIGQELGIKPGEEMLEAIRAAKEKQKPIFLLDRNVNITMKRAFQNMNIIEKAKLIAAITSSLFGIGEQITKEKIEELKKTDIITEIINEMTREMPGLKKALVDERDSYIANNIAKMPGKKNCRSSRRRSFARNKTKNRKRNNFRKQNRRNTTKKSFQQNSTIHNSYNFLNTNNLDLNK